MPKRDFSYEFSQNRISYAGCAPTFIPTNDNVHTLRLSLDVCFPAQSLPLHFEMTRFHLGAASRSFAKICMVHIVIDIDWNYGLDISIKYFRLHSTSRNKDQI